MFFSSFILTNKGITKTFPERRYFFWWIQPYIVFRSGVNILIRSAQETGLQKPVDIFIDTMTSLDSTSSEV